MNIRSLTYNGKLPTVICDGRKYMDSMKALEYHYYVQEWVDDLLRQNRVHTFLLDGKTHMFPLKGMGYSRFAHGVG